MSNAKKIKIVLDLERGELAALAALAGVLSAVDARDRPGTMQAMAMLMALSSESRLGLLAAFLEESQRSLAEDGGREAMALHANGVGVLAGVDQALAKLRARPAP